MFIEKAAELLKQNYWIKTPSRNSNKVKFTVNYTCSIKNTNTDTINRISGTNFISTISELGIQLVSEDNRQEIIKRAKKILDLLRNIEIGILGSTVSAEDLRDIVKNIENISTDDSRLQGIFDEIKLRAKVEIAKYSA